jgi:hypothetical protein
MYTESDVIKNVCCDILKNMTKNMRYVLKRGYFDKCQQMKSASSPLLRVSQMKNGKLSLLCGQPHNTGYVFASVKEMYAYCCDRVSLYVC